MQKVFFHGTLKLLHITTMSVFIDLFAELGMNKGLQHARHHFTTELYSQPFLFHFKMISLSSPDRHPVKTILPLEILHILPFNSSLRLQIDTPTVVVGFIRLPAPSEPFANFLKSILSLSLFLSLTYIHILSLPLPLTPWAFQKTFPEL
jgi:hypothetical protein